MYKYPIKDSYVTIQATDGNKYYLFGYVNGKANYDASHNIRRATGKLEPYGKYFAVHAQPDRTSSTLLLNTFQVVTITKEETAIDYPANVQKALATLSDDTATDVSIKAAKATVNQYFSDNI